MNLKTPQQGSRAIRPLVTLLSALSVTALLAACTSSGGGPGEEGSGTSTSGGQGGQVEGSYEGQTLNVMTYGGIYTDTEGDAYFTPFSNATGAEVNPVTPMSIASLQASIQAGSPIADVLSAAGMDYFQAVEADLLEPIDYSLVEKIGADHLYEEYGVVGHSIGYQLVYNTETYASGAPTGWADFWDIDSFPGDRSLWDTPVGNIEFALLADGYSKDDLYPLDEEKVNRAFAKLDEIKPFVKVWWTEGAQSQQIFADGEADMMMMWNGRTTDLQNEGFDIAPVWEGAAIATNRWMIPKGTSNAALANEFINIAQQPESQAKFAVMNYGPSNEGAFEFMDAGLMETQPTSAEHLEAGFVLDVQWWGNNINTLLPRWQDWLTQ